MLKNVFAILAHEHPSSVWDQVQNITYCDPSSRIVIYDSSGDEAIKRSQYNWKRSGVEFVTPSMQLCWGELHRFALSSIEYLADSRYDTITFFDSDQLMLRKGYSSFLQKMIREPFGVLTTEVCCHGLDSTLPMVRDIHAEWPIWQRYFERFPNHNDAFVRTTFWPGTVISADAARAIVKEFKNEVLQNTLSQSHVWATEEILIPTISYLLGYKEILNPCDRTWCTFRTPWSSRNIIEALEAPNAYYIHPISTSPENEMRKLVKDCLNGYTE